MTVWTKLWFIFWLHLVLELKLWNRFKSAIFCIVCWIFVHAIFFFFWFEKLEKKSRLHVYISWLIICSFWCEKW